MPEYDISYRISPTVITVYDSYLVKDDDTKRAVISKLLSQAPDFPRRDVGSLLREWKAHNILYGWGIRPESTRDVDLDVGEPLWRRMAYWFLAFFFKE